MSLSFCSLQRARVAACRYAGTFTVAIVGPGAGVASDRGAGQLIGLVAPTTPPDYYSVVLENEKVLVLDVPIRGCYLEATSDFESA
jgi:hypothetical protein